MRLAASAPVGSSTLPVAMGQSFSDQEISRASGEIDLPTKVTKHGRMQISSRVAPKCNNM